MVQWLRLHAPTAGGASSIPGERTKILHILQYGKKKKKKKEQLKLANQPDMGLRGALVYCENSNVSTWILEKVIHSGAAGEQEKRCGYETLEKWRLFVTTA